LKIFIEISLSLLFSLHHVYTSVDVMFVLLGPGGIWQP